MENLSITILKEAVHFLEICQEHVFNGKIPANLYFSLSDLKIKFIKNVLENNKESILLDTDLNSRLEKVFENDIFIYNYIGNNKIYMA
ncbi:MAG TPA: hypothetical protein VIO64_21925 [Pseudobacteroides sp.]|uniref:hypothetical protein n=1 Tax=Pseudobacteroides sp. TaxID=1968840 RepID=UPI002F94D505